MVVVFDRRAGRSPAMSPDRMMGLGRQEVVFALGDPVMMAVAMMMPLRGGGHDRMMMMVVMVTFRARECGRGMGAVVMVVMAHPRRGPRRQEGRGQDGESDGEHTVEGRSHGFFSGFESRNVRRLAPADPSISRGRGRANPR